MGSVVKNQLAGPVVKWVGGKRQLLDAIRPLLPAPIGEYCEPFLGGGALLFDLQPEKAIVNDLNEDLVALYETIRDDLEPLLEDLRRHENTPAYFYALRNLDRDRAAYGTMTSVARASRLLYLNKTCFNGLFRVNAAGEFNAPFGRYKNPNIVNEPVLRAVSQYLAASDIKFYHEDFAAVLERVSPGAFVYLDPPYDPLSDTASFTGYHKAGFGKEEQIRLKRQCDELTRRGIRFMLSNSATEFIKDLYRDYDITLVKAKRAINANPKKRGQIEEVLIRNYA